jgi:predicted phosphohydrolase
VRVVAVADTHGFQTDLGRIPDGDLFVHAGDLCRAGTLQELSAAADWIRALPHRHKVVVAGNHERCLEDTPAEARARLGPELQYLQDSGCTIEGLRLWGSPWQPAYNDWAFNRPRGAALAERWALIPEGLDLLITHGPPAGFGDRSGVAGRAGCAELRAAVERAAPRVHLFGHIHADGGAWRLGPSWLFNVTTWEGERGPTVLDVHPDGRVIPVDVPPREGRPRRG